jgi:Ca2+-binding EF-hand superfamily protein
MPSQKASARASNAMDKFLSKRFRTYDFDGSGYLERADFEAVANRVLKEFGYEAGAPEMARFRDLQIGVWNRLLEVADETKDGRISEDEYKV